MELITRNNYQSLESPVKETLSWKSSEAAFIYWNKDAEEEVKVESFQLLLLLQMSSISGYNEKDKVRIWSNEVSKTTSEKLDVRKGNSIVLSGLYKDIKSQLPDGAKFTKACYFYGSINGGTPDIYRVLFSGSSFGGREKKSSEDGKKAVELEKNDLTGGWIEFCNKNKRFEVAVLWKGQTVEGKNGNVIFKAPVLEAGKIEPRHVDMANKNADIVANYLKAKASATVEETLPSTTSDPEGVYLPEDHDVDDKLPF
jgi:hypothetical protein